MAALEYQASLDVSDIHVLIVGIQQSELPSSFPPLGHSKNLLVDWASSEASGLECIQAGQSYDIIVLDCRHFPLPTDDIRGMRTKNRSAVFLGLIDSYENGEKANATGLCDLLVDVLMVDAVFPWLTQQQMERKRMSHEGETLKSQLKDFSYQNEMADVASTVLHNVGNVLNSVKVAAEVVESCVKESSVVLVNKIADLLAGHDGGIEHFLTQDPKGKRIPGAIQKLAPHLLEEQQEILKEIQVVVRNLDHVKHIITSHQMMAKTQGIVEPVSLLDLLEQALELSFQPADSSWVHIRREFQEVPEVSVDKHQVLQILVNLLRNAKQAMFVQPNKAHELTLRVENDVEKDSFVVLSIKDSGMGIAPEHVSQMFSRGFTTKKDGNGIGLHSSALTMRKMGGHLEVYSEGVGCGAVFTLRFPLEACRDSL